MSKTHSLRRAVRCALLAGAAVAAAPSAYAQDPSIQEIVVTGSRIRIRDFEAISPVATVSADSIKSSGELSVEEVLNRLPQVVPGLTANSNNPANGTATVDLRGVGPQRTLVLVNGRRLTPSTKSGIVDLNNVPTRLIERVEVVTAALRPYTARMRSPVSSTSSSRKTSRASTSVISSASRPKAMARTNSSTC